MWQAVLAVHQLDAAAGTVGTVAERDVVRGGDTYAAGCLEALSTAVLYGARAATDAPDAISAVRDDGILRSA